MIALLVLLLQDCSAQSYRTIDYACDNKNDSCTSCFNRLAHELINSSKNQFELQNVFFPPDKSTPVFVVVYYHYSNTSLDLDGVDLEMDLEKEAEMDSNTWFWSAYTYYVLFNPLEVYQYTSLLFGDPSFRSSEINLTLPGECHGADNKMMTMLTQRVCIINIPQS